MPQIRFVKKKPPVIVDTSDNLMRALLDAGHPVASSCYGRGICGKCRLHIVEGQKNLSAESQLEKDLRQRHQVPDGYRISCQTSVLGDVTVDTDYW